MTEHRPEWLRRIAALVVRGPDAPYILADLEEAFVRDLERGMAPAKARRRYLANALSSAMLLVVTGRALGLGASWLDVKLGFRMLFKQPGLTLVAVFALSVGIPVGLLPQHILSSLMAPLPVPQGDEVLMVKNWNLHTSTSIDRPIHDFVRWREDLTSFSALGIAARRQYNLIADDGRAAPLSGAEVTASVFQILRVQPILGRHLYEADEVRGAPDVVVLGYDAWRSRLAGDPAIVGKTVRIGNVPHTVVGVMPEGFLFPVRDHLWVPFRHHPIEYDWGHGPRGNVLGRLVEGVSMEEANQEILFYGQRMAAEFPDTHQELQARVVPYTEGMMGLEPTENQNFLMLKAMGLLLLALACGNVGILVLARASTRSGELAVRTALGASRARIVGQLFVESLLLALVAAGVGLAIGEFVSTRFGELEQFTPYWIDFHITSRTAFAALVLAVFSAVLAGVVPALKATGKNVQVNMQGSAGNPSGIRFGTASTVLVVAEVAVAIWFLTLSAGLVPSALAKPGGLGIQTDKYLHAYLQIPWDEPEEDAAEAYEAQFRERVATVHIEFAQRLTGEPGLGPAAIATTLPGMSHATQYVQVEGEPLVAGSLGTKVKISRVDVDYFSALEQSILSGRDFNQADLGEGANAIIVNTSFADRVLGRSNPLGHRIRYAAPDGEKALPWYEIVGVVGPLGMNELNPAADAGMYFVEAPGDLHPVAFAIKVGDDPTSAVQRLREIAAEIDPSVMLRDPTPLNEVFNGDRFLTKWIGLLFGLIALIAVVLSSAGLYALMSFTVAQRTREIGIRTALGARPASIVSSIAKRAFAQLTAGVIIGTVASVFLMTHDPAGQTDIVLRAGTWPVVISLIALGMIVVGMLACVSPTRRGLRIRPVEALKG